MIRASWNGQIIAEADKTVRVEGNHYFPPESLNRQYFQDNTLNTTCAWKGVASYYDIVVDGEVNQAAAWYYPTPSNAASQIKDHVAFYGSVKVETV